MLFPATALKRSFLAGVLVTGSGLSAFGQAADSPLVFSNTDAITTTFVQPVTIGSSSSSGSDDNKWLKVEFRYGVTPKTGDYLDSAEFRIWIEGRDLLDPQATSKDGIAIGLTGTVTYVNIPKGKDVYGVFYVHPNTLARYSTTTGSSDFERKFNIHIEAYIGGAKVDFFDRNKEQDLQWYTQLKPVAGFVYRQDQSPFLLTDVSHYPAIKLPAPAAAQ